MPLKVLDSNTEPVAARWGYAVVAAPEGVGFYAVYFNRGDEELTLDSEDTEWFPTYEEARSYMIDHTDTDPEG